MGCLRHPDDPLADARTDGPDTSATVRTSAVAPRTPVSTGLPKKDKLPERIGQYAIKYEIGRGGMGVVYMAVHKDEGFHRRVAIKLLKRGVDTEDILKRFEQERQLLASLSHPNIARLIDAGATDDGRPYLVMEYIEGEPLDKFCDLNRYGVRERLDLFRQLCHAVQYLHQNLVIHRDLKPGNVLVTPEGQVKVLDLGIAKIINPNLADLTVMTGPEMRLMTPEYASPEQVSGRPLTTASDIYALGVILYELVTGRRPYRFRTRIHDEIVRIICEVDPERPSTAITHAEEIPTSDGGTRTVDPETFARTRDGDLRNLRRRLSGDIDDMVMMAMDKVPTRRYHSAEQFASDIELHLHGMPILARAGRARRLYTVRKFIGRHRVGMAAATLVFASLVVGLAGAGAGWQNAERAREAEHQARLGEEKAVDALSNALDLSTNVLTRIHGRVTRLAASTDAEKAIVDVTLAHLQSLEQSYGDVPEIDRAIAYGYLKLGDIQSGLRSAGIGETANAIRSYERSREIWTDLGARAPFEEIPVRLWQVDVSEGKALFESGDLEGAERVQDAALSRFPPVEQGAEPTERQVQGRAIALKDHAETLAALGRLDEAEAELRESEALRSSFYDEQASQAKPLRRITTGQIALALFLDDREQFDEADRLLTKALDLRRRALMLVPEGGREIGDLAVAQMYAARVKARLGSTDEALRLLDEAEPAFRDQAADDQTDIRAQHRVAIVLLERARVLLLGGRPDEARRVAAQAFPVVEEIRDRDADRMDYDTLAADLLDIRAEAALQLGDAMEGINEAVRAVSLRKRVSAGTRHAFVSQRRHAHSAAILATGVADAGAGVSRRDVSQALDEARTALAFLRSIAADSRATTAEQQDIERLARAVAQLEQR